jgi:hypothetical protein
MPSPQPDAPKPRKCPHGHDHMVIQQFDNNTCGPRALRMALIAMGLGARTPESTALTDVLPLEQQLEILSNGARPGRRGWQGKNLETAVRELEIGYRLQVIGRGRLGEAVRKPSPKPPILAHCHGSSGGARFEGHWVVIVGRNESRHWWVCDTFCVLDSASGKALDVAIHKKDGSGSAEFTDHQGKSWRLELKGGYEFVKDIARLKS